MVWTPNKEIRAVAWDRLYSYYEQQQDQGALDTMDMVLREMALDEGVPLEGDYD